MEKLTYQLLPQDHKTNMGLIVLQSDVTIEDEFRHYFKGQPISLLANRIPFENQVTSDTLKQMEGHIANTMSLFPITSEFDCVGYACTSGALHIGSQRIEHLVQQERTSRSVTNPMQAAVNALRHIGASNIAFLAPYSQCVTQTMIDELQAHDINIVVSATYDEDQDAYVGRISPESIYQSAVELCKGQSVDAIFIACTNMKCADVIPRIEAETGVYALSSNLVLAWDMARLAGCSLNPSNGERLSAKP